MPIILSTNHDASLRAKPRVRNGSMPSSYRNFRWMSYGSLLGGLLGLIFLMMPNPGDNYDIAVVVMIACAILQIANGRYEYQLRWMPAGLAAALATLGVCCLLIYLQAPLVLFVTSALIAMALTARVARQRISGES